MSRRTKYTIEEVKKYALSKGGECLSEVYKNNKVNLDWKCGKCNHIWKTNFKAIKVQENWCPCCSGRLNNNIETIRKLAIERGGECLSSKYKDNKDNLEWKCGICKHVWMARLDRVKSGTWCPSCKRSHGEREISKYLDTHKIKNIQEYNIKLKNMRLDFYIPEYNLAIEYDGVQHFQVYRRYTPDEETLKIRQQFDIEKTRYCISNGIRLVRIHYKSLNSLGKVLDDIFKNESDLIFTYGKEYEYITKELTTKYDVL